MYRNGPQRRNVSEKLDFVIGFVPFGDEGTRGYFDAADVVVAKQIRLAAVQFRIAREPGKSLLGQHRDVVVNRLQIGFVRSIHWTG